METILKILSPYGIQSLEGLIVGIIITFIAIKEIYGSIKWIKDRFEGYHEEKNKIEEHDDNIESRISTLEKHDKWQYNQLEGLKAQLTDLTQLVKENHTDIHNQLTELSKNNKEIAVASLRDTINRIHRYAISKGRITHQDLLTFTEAVKTYRDAGGDGMVDEKLYPEVISLPISDEQLHDNY